MSNPFKKRNTEEDTYFCGICGHVPIARRCVHMPGEERAMDDNARKAALWLSEALRNVDFKVAPIDFETHGLQARVLVNGRDAGQLGPMWEELRNGTLIARLNAPYLEEKARWLRDQREGDLPIT